MPKKKKEPKYKYEIVAGNAITIFEDGDYLCEIVTEEDHLNDNTIANAKRIAAALELAEKRRG